MYILSTLEFPTQTLTFIFEQLSPVCLFQVSDPVVLEARDDRTETYLRTIREHLNPSIQIVVIVFPTSRDDRYAAVKKLCCVECPVPSQVQLRNGSVFGVLCRSVDSCGKLAKHKNSVKARLHRRFLLRSFSF